MTYSCTQREARYKIASGQQGDIITMWHRRVTTDEEGNPDVVTFEAHCSEDPGIPRCEINFLDGVDENGRLLLVYNCLSVNCDNCTLQYSRDGEEWQTVSEAEPSQTESCYFRCQCGG